MTGQFTDLFSLLAPQALIQLKLALKFLDMMKSEIAAAHVSGAIDAFEADINERGIQDLKAEELDELINQLLLADIERQRLVLDGER